jgi:hypothetical protein
VECSRAPFCRPCTPRPPVVVWGFLTGRTRPIRSGRVVACVAVGSAARSGDGTASPAALLPARSFHWRINQSGRGVDASTSLAENFAGHVTRILSFAGSVCSVTVCADGVRKSQVCSAPCANVKGASTFGADYKMFFFREADYKMLGFAVSVCCQRDQEVSPKSGRRSTRPAIHTYEPAS